MTVNSTSSSVTYPANGVTTVFPFTFAVIAAGDLLVLVRDENGEVELAAGVDYTVSVNANQNTSPGGSVAMTTAPVDDATVYVGRNVSAVQPLDLINGGQFRAENIEAALDRITMLAQQLLERFARSLSLSATDASAASLPELTPAQRASKFLGFDSAGNWLVGNPVASSALVMTSYMQGLMQLSIANATQFRAQIGSLADSAGAITTAHLQGSSVTTAKMAASALAASDTGLAIMQDGFFANTQNARNKFVAGFFAANVYCRSLFADKFITLEKIADGTVNKYIGFNSVGAASELPAPLYTKRFTSTEIAITSSGTSQLDIDHGLGVMPTRIRCYLKCVTYNATHLWAVGDLIEISHGTITSGVFIALDANKIYLKQNTVAPLFYPKTSSTALAFAAQAVNFKLVIVAEA